MTSQLSVFPLLFLIQHISPRLPAVGVVLLVCIHLHDELPGTHRGPSTCFPTILFFEGAACTLTTALCYCCTKGLTLGCCKKEQ